jgi:hypothetical protein
MKEALSALSKDILVPPVEIESGCTDINGVLAQIESETSKTLTINILETDGDQNCNGDNDIKKLTSSPDNKAIVIIILPGTDSAGKDDFDLRKQMFETAIPWAVIIPHHEKNIENAVAEAINKSQTYSGRMQK